MDRRTQKFMHRQNIVMFKRQLADMPDEALRSMLKALLTEERDRGTREGWSNFIG